MVQCGEMRDPYSAIPDIVDTGKRYGECMLLDPAMGLGMTDAIQALEGGVLVRATFWEGRIEDRERIS